MKVDSSKLEIANILMHTYFKYGNFRDSCIICNIDTQKGIELRDLWYMSKSQGIEVINSRVDMTVKVTI